MAKLVLGFLAAGTLVMAGLWLWDQGHRVASVCPLAAGQFVLMRLVADDLFPRASAALTGALKLTAVSAFLLSGIWGLWLVISSGLLT